MLRYIPLRLYQRTLRFCDKTARSQLDRRALNLSDTRPDLFNSSRVRPCHTQPVPGWIDRIDSFTALSFPSRVPRVRRSATTTAHYKLPFGPLNCLHTTDRRTVGHRGAMSVMSCRCTQLARLTSNLVVQSRQETLRPSSSNTALVVRIMSSPALISELLDESSASSRISLHDSYLISFHWKVVDVRVLRSLTLTH